MDNKFQEVIQQFPPWFSVIAEAVPQHMRKDVSELHLFAGKAAYWSYGKTGQCFGDTIISPKDLQEIFTYLCHGSVHCHQQEITQGFLTIAGGHRVGLCGTALWNHGQVTGLREVTSMCIRFAHEIKGCAQELHRLLKDNSFLLAGAPGTGKTTMLRDYVRILSGGDGGNCEVIAVLDERGELSGFDLGHTAHIIKGLHKAQAIRQALRVLTPQVIVCDEIGSAEEAQLLIECLNCGCRFIGTIHAENWETLHIKPQFQPFLEQSALDAVVFLQDRGEIREIREVNTNENHRLHEPISLRCTDWSIQAAETERKHDAVARNERFSSVLLR